tara:strand:- start:3 stop:233 length:231 start_codon:yes stop_codon:yes gene_type:complete
MKDTPFEKIEKDMIQRTVMFSKTLTFYEIVKVLSKEDDRVEKMEDGETKKLLLLKQEKNWQDLMMQDFFKDLTSEE